MIGRIGTQMSFRQHHPAHRWRWLSSATTPYFSKVLIANRGEIAQRVIRTCQRLGIPTVAVYSTADASAPFVDAAEEAYCLGSSTTCYLDMEAVIQAIQATEATAVHPGYGFLSEQAAFPRAVAQVGATFLGPSGTAMAQLGDKLESKALAQAAGVSVIPGYAEPLESWEQAVELCTGSNAVVPFPVLLKAAAGGGGKGMRVCRSERELQEAWTVAKAESLKFFGDDRLLLEKYVEEPHHIEFQVMAAANPKTDSVDVVVFPERECSIQRRNQKILEETPSVLLTNETREKMAAQVRSLCQTVGYESAGTVEFLVDRDQQCECATSPCMPWPLTQHLHFLVVYFLEMNTRLQVEHPVTEAITGVDLVEAMLSVGAGRGLPKELQDYTNTVVPSLGHALEARIYAEDPVRGFLPSTGSLVRYAEPSYAEQYPYPRDPPYIRLDSGVVPGYTVTPHYDPMISKLISYGTDRLDSINRMRHALDDYVIEGVQHNCRLVQSVLRQPAFISGETPTSFLDTHYPDQFQGVQLEPFELEELAAVAVYIAEARRIGLGRPDLVRNTNDDANESVVVRLGGQFGDAYQVLLSDRGDARVEKIDLSSGEVHGSVPRTMQLSNLDYRPNEFRASLLVDGMPRTIQVLNEQVTGELGLQMYGHKTQALVQSNSEFDLSRLYMKEPPKVDTSNLVQSPMPGLLVSYAVTPGDVVEEGQELCIVESMKMQNMIRSPRSGVIGSCDCETGASVRVDQTLLTFAADP